MSKRKRGQKRKMLLALDVSTGLGPERGKDLRLSSAVRIPYMHASDGRVWACIALVAWGFPRPADVAMNPPHRAEPEKWAPWEREARGFSFYEAHWVSALLSLRTARYGKGAGLPTHTSPTNCFQLYCCQVDHNVTSEKQKGFMLRYKMLLYSLIAVLI